MTADWQSKAFKTRASPSTTWRREKDWGEGHHGWAIVGIFGMIPGLGDGFSAIVRSVDKLGVFGGVGFRATERIAEALRGAERSGGVTAEALRKAQQLMRDNPLLRKELKRFKFAAKFGIMPAKRLQDIKRPAGLGSELQAHHLIEKRFSEVLGVKEGDMLAIALTKPEHEKFTNAWRKLIPRLGEDKKHMVNKEMIFDSARKVYSDYPEFLNVLGLKK